MDRNQFFPPHTALQPQFFPPPNLAFTSSFPPTGYCIPPPIAPNMRTKTYNNFDLADIESMIAGKRNETKNDSPLIKVHEFSEKIQEFFHSLKRLKSLLEKYESCKNDSSDSTQHNLLKEINKEQEYISNLKISMNIYLENIPILKRKISQRKRKRRRKFNRSPALNSHQIAADHMQRLLQIAADKEQDEKLKKDADNILSDVLRKKNEANNCIRLLNSLEKLYVARCNSSGANFRNAGYIAVIEKLKTLWETQLKEYAVEENGFRVMLEELAMDRKKESNENTDRIFEEWCKSLFGVSDLRAFSYHSGVDDFIRIRHSWDKYVVPDCDVRLKIPPGWVLPENRHDSPWTKFIRK